MKKLAGTLLSSVLLLSTAWAKDCTVSNRFKLIHPQLLNGVLKDSIPAPLPGFRLELISDGKVKGEVVTNKNGEYSFGELPAGQYRIRIPDGFGFCAPKVKCGKNGCLIGNHVEPNMKNSVEVE